MVIRLFIAFILCPYLFATESTFNQIQESLTLEAPNGTSQNLDKNAFIRQVNVDNNLGKWYAEVQLVDDENNEIDGQVYRVSRKYLNVAIGVMFFNSLKLYDENGNDAGSLPGGFNIVRIGEGSHPFEHYLLAITDDDGGAIWLDGTPYDPRSGEPYPTYKVRKESFHAELLNNKINELVFLTHDDNSGATCDVSATGVPAVDPELGRTRPKPRPTNLNVPSPYDVVMGRRSSLKGKRGCESDRREIERGLLSSEWSGLSLHQKADKIYSLAKDVRSEIIQKSNESGQNVRKSSRFQNSVNPHYFPDNGIKPELVACIVFQETEGHLNYTSHNFTYCANTKSPRSSAHGLTQFTRTTFRMMKNHPDGDQAPFNTTYSAPLNGKSAHEAHKLMSRYPGAQIEMAYRLLNHEYKRAYVSSPNKTRTQLLRAAVLAYDKDNQSEYIRNVMEKCLPCMNKSGNNGSDCYEEVYE